MADLVGFDSDFKARHSWYKEKLHKKYLKESNHKLNYSGALNTQNWTFLAKELDDFRDGYPSSSDTVIQSTKGPAPVLQNSGGATHRKSRRRFTKEQACYSKLLPLQQAQREYIAEIEYGLTQHPLALYPHLEEGLPSEIFEDIVDILDPEMRLRSASGSFSAVHEEDEDEFDTSSKEHQESQSIKSRDASTRQSAISEESKQKNPYTWLSHIEESDREDKKLKNMRSVTPAQDEAIKHVTKDFCDWVASLGGEESNIQEATIFSLFASGYDTKPALSVPIHVVELNNVPAELRTAEGATTPKTSVRSIHAKDFKTQSKEPGYFPSWVKPKYGAWYLNPKTWKKQNINEQLMNPKAEETGTNIHSKSTLSLKDEELLKLHGTISFKEFIEKKGYRKPEFLWKLYSTHELLSREKSLPGESKTASSVRDTWFRSDSASSQEDSIIN